jgi:hypothetical protein
MIKKLIPHICVILSLFVITYVILNEFNPAFFSKGFFKVSLIIYSLATLLTSSILIAINRRS